jgi:hypothetical protein
MIFLLVLCCLLKLKLVNVVVKATVFNHIVRLHLILSRELISGCDDLICRRLMMIEYFIELESVGIFVTIHIFGV